MQNLFIFILYPTGRYGRRALREEHEDRTVRPAEIAWASHIRRQDSGCEGRDARAAREARPFHVDQAGRNRR